MNITEITKERDLYKKMYYLLGARVSDIIDICKDPLAKRKLIEAHQETEEIYISIKDKESLE